MSDLNPEILDKWDHLIDRLKSFENIGVALSGGVDSALVCAAGVQAVWNKKVTAFTILSTMENPLENEDARRITELLQVNLVTIELDELEIEEVRSNPPDRCYHCKNARLKEISNQASHFGIGQLVDGSNADDLNDYRPGRKALLEQGIVSPLAESGITKKEVRLLAKWLGLPVWNKPSEPCLASRFPYGTEINHTRLQQVACAEKVLRQSGFTEFRVRYHESVARIEVHPDSFEFIMKRHAEIVTAIKNCGFTYVTLDLQGFRSGSLNEGLI